MKKDLGNCQRCDKELSASNYYFLIEKHLSLCDECMTEWLTIRKLESDFLDKVEKERVD